jgi:hypothetical protein
MRSPGLFRTRVGLPVVLFCFALSGGVSACASAEGSGDMSIVVEVLQDEITVENKTGTGLSKGEVSIIPQGFARPFVTNITYMTNGSKQTFPMGNFRASDGSKFRRDVVNGKAVKVTIKDVAGKNYTREVPFK